jgi:hypothetical protein
MLIFSQNLWFLLLAANDFCVFHACESNVFHILMSSEIKPSSVSDHHPLTQSYNAENQGVAELPPPLSGAVRIPSY